MTKLRVSPNRPSRSPKRSAKREKTFRQVDATKTMAEHEIAQKAFSTNRERLKAERLAREAVGTRERSQCRTLF
jgi:hypothetical protein